MERKYTPTKEEWLLWKDFEFYPCPPFQCHCGCKEKIKVQSHHKYYGIPVYLPGHNTGKYSPWEKRICANSYCASVFECKVNSKQKYCCLSCRPAWNKDLTKKIDNRVANKLEGKTYEEIYGERRAKELKLNLCEVNTGKKHSAESKEKNKQKAVKMWQDPEHSIKQRSGLLKKWLDPEFREKMIEVHPRGENHFNWKGGVSSFLYPLEFDEKLKSFIRERDNYTCQLCGKSEEENGRRLSVHHIDYIKEHLDPFNLISLCIRCNPKVNYNRSEWIEYFQSLILEKESICIISRVS